MCDSDVFVELKLSNAAWILIVELGTIVSDVTKMFKVKFPYKVVWTAPVEWQKYNQTTLLNMPDALSFIYNNSKAANHTRIKTQWVKTDKANMPAHSMFFSNSGILQ